MRQARSSLLESAMANQMAYIERSFEDLRGSMIAEEFLASCHKEVAIFLKDRNLKTAAELSKHTDRYLEAQGQRNLGKAQDEKGLEKKEQTRSAIKCYLCDKIGHRAANCAAGRTHSSSPKNDQCGKRGHTKETCRDRSGNTTGCMVADESSADGDRKKQRDQEDKDKISAVTTSVKAGEAEDATPVVAGMLHGRKVSVLRDTSSNIDLVREFMVPETDITGTEKPVRLACRADASC
ncbi:hypothetical protein HPB51_026866 [Rhipicephalus microplus]|uniref:CCHC-type domain-containing protein n=1 Tax=Rhipicephalus microplus TaxID=6941 RepID=A0A9J6D260_RHIMP|nr:hypothetical protein HPB51_026866 [Rhipicephalus microplus]